MKIRLAKHAGFCSGVSRALGKVLEETGRHEKVYTLGPLAHNEAVTSYLAGHGVVAVEAPAEASGGVLVIRTHGVAPAVVEHAREMAELTLLDLTCPRVRRVQRFAAELAGKGVQLIIYGDTRHPEVQGVVGWAGGRALVVSSAEEFNRLELKEQAALLAQTTGDRAVYEEIKELFTARVPGGQVFDTLCPETGLRQEEAARLAGEVDAMVVVGSAASANTRALVEFCRRLSPTCRVAHAGELDPAFLQDCRSVGVTAGASAPHWTIKEVVERMEKEGFSGENEAAAENDAAKNGMAEENEAAVENDAAAAEQETAQEGAMTTADETAAGKDTTTVDQDEAENIEAEAQFAYGTDFKAVQAGEQVVGKVVRANPDEVFLDIGYKTEALLPLAEVYLGEGETLPERFASGDELEVTVLNVDDQEGNVVVSHKRLAREKRWQELEQALRDEVVMEGKVKHVVPAGMVVDLNDGIEGFMPGSLVDTRFVPDFNQFLGETVHFKVIEFNREKDKVILSRKKVLEEESARNKEETLATLEVGAAVPGVVRRLTDFGAFVDIGGIDGLVHISELSWERVEHPRDLLKVGDQVEVKVLEVIPDRERISLSLRQTQPDPWARAMDELENGQIVRGKVTRLANFGAFIELRPGVEGLAHISQLTDYHVKHPSEVLQEGEELNVKILELKPAAKRISLSIKEAGGVARDQGLDDKAADNSNVTLGDVFGDLFEQGKEAPAEADAGEPPPEADETAKEEEQG